MKSDDTLFAGRNAFRAAGPGHLMTFRCASCANPRQVLGRRLRMTQGLRQWVCSGCAGVKK